MVLRKVLRIMGKALLGLLGFILCYGLAVWLLPMNGANTDYSGPESGELVYIRSNGVHTDIILPLRSAAKDWSVELPFSNTASDDSAFTHVAFGWGDKGFYLETKEWADLKASTALKAMFGLSGSAMHVTFCQVPQVNERCRSVRVDAATLQRLTAKVDAGFARDNEGGPQWIADRHYEQDDAFYEGTGRYGLFFTCNTWANSVLKDCSLPAAAWTATAGGILRQYPDQDVPRATPSAPDGHHRSFRSQRSSSSWTITSGPTSTRMFCWSSPSLPSGAWWRFFLQARS